jgi:TatA/E family protein of Tat protein translocase
MQNNNIQYSMFNLGTGELVFIFLIILLLFGAKRLPDLAKGLGKGIKEFKGAVETGKKEIMDAKENLDSIDKNKNDN